MVPQYIFKQDPLIKGPEGNTSILAFCPDWMSADWSDSNNTATADCNLCV